MVIVSRVLQDHGVRVTYVDAEHIFLIAEDREIFEILSGKKVKWEWENQSLKDYQRYQEHKTRSPYR